MGPKKRVSVTNDSATISISSENLENPKGSQDIAKPKNTPQVTPQDTPRDTPRDILIKSEQTKQDNSQQLQTSKNTHETVSKYNTYTDKISDKDISPENAENTENIENTENTENKKLKNFTEKSNEMMKSRRSSVLPNPTDLLKIKPPKKSKKEKIENNQTYPNNMDESNRKENTEQNSVSSKKSRRSSVLPNPSDLLKVKLPKKSVSKSNDSE